MARMFGGVVMETKKIKWGNILIFLLIIAAVVAAFYYKNPQSFTGLFNRENSGEVKTVESEEKAAATQSDDKTANNTDAFVVGLDSWIGGTPALIALSREYNRDYDLKLKLEYIGNDRDRILALQEGRIHVTEMSLPSYVKFLEKYPDAGVIVGITDFSRGADGIVARQAVKDLNDMEGRKVSYVKDGTGKFILNKFLRLTGLRYQDILPVERESMGEVMEDLRSGNADLVVSWSPDMNLAVKSINGEKPDSVRLLITTKEVPNLVPTVLVAAKSAVDNQPDKVEAFLRTWFASAKYILERPEKAHELLAQSMSHEKDTYGAVAKGDVTDSFANIRLLSLNDNFVYFGKNGQKGLFETIIADTATTWKKYGDIEENILPDKTLDGSFMEKLAEENDEELLVDTALTEKNGNAGGVSEDQTEFKKQDDVSIEKNTEKVAKVDIPPVYYDSGRSTVTKESIPVLDEVLNVLSQFPGYYLIVDAHTDSVGGDEANLKLSRERAAEVKKYLLSKGIDENRIVARGWGETRPVIQQENSESDRSKNRRTEFILTREAK
jgi:outer membrane protein OmpA-like peptidoglycan-associated protein/ABC-type amino acid transport substrate-binding protein